MRAPDMGHISDKGLRDCGAGGGRCRCHGRSRRPDSNRVVIGVQVECVGGGGGDGGDRGCYGLLLVDARYDLDLGVAGAEALLDQRKTLKHRRNKKYVTPIRKSEGKRLRDSLASASGCRFRYYELQTNLLSATGRLHRPKDLPHSIYNSLAMRISASDHVDDGASETLQQHGFVKKEFYSTMYS